jgi:dGTPase
MLGINMGNTNNNHGRKCCEKLEKWEIDNIKPYGLRSRERRDSTDHFREHASSQPLEYRTEYHRDRDRIIWARSYKRLQHKTQIFPHYATDHFRRRLTHSIEVAQIATTIARGLNLNETAVEAMALGHDLGHTPFGHGGEDALNEATLNKKKDIKKKVKNPKVPVFGFDHCSHGVEIVSRLEKPYKKTESSHYGLNLSIDVREGILKHIYKHSGSLDKTKPFSILREVLKLDSYKKFDNSVGSLEAQCVWYADKISYLLSDIEDGARRKILKPDNLRNSDFYNKIGIQYKKLRANDLDHELEDFDDLMQVLTNYVLPTLILDVIKTTNKKIRDFEIKSIDDLKKYPKERFVSNSQKLKETHIDFYKEVIAEKIFKHEEVVASNYKAKLIVSELFNAYCQEMNLIPSEYRESVKEAYKDLVDDNIIDIYIARCYIAGMTDAFAFEKHRSLYMTSERSISF